ncbi:MAG TPA: ATP-binding protein [Candidatus Limnocylindrales bacterium]|nr:ATP-binding protein [Candidatus Limnocylindrales bacterium]
MKLLDRMPIRLRLTLVFTGALALVLTATGAFVYLRLAATLDRAVDDNLRSRAADAAAQLRRGSPDLSTMDLGETGLVQVIDPDGALVAVTRGAGERFRLPGGQLQPRVAMPGSDDYFLVRASKVDVGGRTYTIVVGDSLEPRDEALEGLLTQLLVVGPIALAAAALAGYLLAAAALRPVDAMSRQARAVSALEPGRRLTVPPARDELARLAETLNEMLGRLEQALTWERRFVAEASHELRTPLALLRTEVELALGRAYDADELELALRSVAEETHRLCLLAEDLLVMARSHAGGLPLRRESLSAKELLETVGQRFAYRAEAAGRRLTVSADPDLAVYADRLRAEQAIGNLLDNALRHGGDDIQLTTSARDGHITMHVRDNGPGWSAGNLVHAPRTTGLGLNIVDVIAKAHGGSSNLKHRDGTTDASITLPAGCSADDGRNHADHSRV